ncbi:MAG: hypothetical protein QXI16_03210 [Sulfolobaceae archaeon]
MIIISPHSILSLPSSLSQNNFSSENNGLAVIPSPLSNVNSSTPKTPLQTIPYVQKLLQQSQPSSSSSVSNSTGSPYIIVQPQNKALAVSQNENIVTPNIEPQIQVSVPSPQSSPSDITVNVPNPLSLSNPVTWIIIGLLVVLVLIIIFEGVR